MRQAGASRAAHTRGLDAVPPGAIASELRPEPLTCHGSLPVTTDAPDRLQPPLPFSKPLFVKPKYVLASPNCANGCRLAGHVSRPARDALPTGATTTATHTHAARARKSRLTTAATSNSPQNRKTLTACCVTRESAITLRRDPPSISLVRGTRGGLFRVDNLSVDAVAAGDISHDLLATELVEHARARAKRRLGGASEKVALGMAAAFVVVAVACAVLLPASRHFSPLAAVLAVAAYGFASRVQFEVRNNFAQPTQLVLIPMFFVLPVRAVPLLVAAGYVVGQLYRRTHPLSHIPIDIANAWYSLGPAVVLALAGLRQPSWRDAPLYLAALAAQLVVDFSATSIWSRTAYRVPVREHLKSMRETALVDAALSPVALVVAIAAAARGALSSCSPSSGSCISSHRNGSAGSTTRSSSRAPTVGRRCSSGR